jgi:alpha-mannosidase
MTMIERYQPRSRGHDGGMHDDGATVAARLARVLTERILPAERSRRSPLTVGAWAVPGEPVAVAEALDADYEPCVVASPWGPPWGTTWFRVEGAVPPGWVGRRVEACLDLGFGPATGFGAEGLIWAPDGPEGPGGDRCWLPRRGLHPRNHEVLVADPALGGERFSVLVEAASNPDLTRHRPDPNADLATAGTAPLYVLGPVELAVIETDVRALRIDIGVLRQLLEQLPTDQPRRPEILRALERALDVLVLDDVAATAARARAELTEVLARPAVPSAHRISAVGHAHIDTAWLWPMRETKRKCARTFTNVLALMDDSPEFRFACSQAAQYEWMRDDYPSIFEAISARVADDRWIPVGGMWVEPDTNLTSGESLVRQLLHGQRFFRDHFGVESTEVWIPDVFGYSAALPQIMRLAGIDRFLTQKLSWNDTNRFPHHSFLWEGIDGSTVFTHFPPVETYNATMAPAELAHAVNTFSDKGRATRSLMPFGYGDGGGGPTPTMMERFRRVRDLEGLPRVEIEAPSDFFAAAMAEYTDPPRWVGELYFEAHRGTYTSQAKTKAGNRRCEHLLREAELWCLAAYGATATDGYPADELDRLWKTVLIHQFHDILPGSSITWVHREAEKTYAETIAALEALITGALARVVQMQPAGRASRAVWLANGAPVDRDEIVVVGGAGDTGRAPTAEGTDSQALADGTIAVRAAIPAFGLARTSACTYDDRRVVVDDRSLDNGLVRVELDERGLFSSVFDHEERREVLAPGATGNLLQLHPDLPNQYDAWDLEAFGRRQVIDLDGEPSIETVDAGPLIGRIRISRSFRRSTVSQTIQLRAGSRRIDVRCEVDWHERDQVLKVAFPVDVHTDEVTREIQFGHVRSKIHSNTSWDVARFEVCAHRWIDVSETDYGVALLNDCKYGHDVTRTRHRDHDRDHDRDDGDQSGTTMRLTLLRSPRYPDPHADEGHHEFTYALLPHPGTAHTAAVVRDIIAEGYRLNIAVRTIPGSVVPVGHGRGDNWAPSRDRDSDDPTPAVPLPPFVRSTNPAVVIEAVKPAEDGTGDVVVRLYEATGSRTSTTIHIGRPVRAATIVDLLERPLPTVPPTPGQRGEIRVELRPFQLLTLRLVPT